MHASTVLSLDIKTIYAAFASAISKTFYPLIRLTAIVLIRYIESAVIVYDILLLERLLNCGLEHSGTKYQKNNRAYGLAVF